MKIDGVGTTSSSTRSHDVVMVLPFIKPEICRLINIQINGRDGVGEESGAFGHSLRKYKGAFLTTSAQVWDNTPTIPKTVGDGLKTGCFCDSSDSNCPETAPHYFYHVLIER